MAMGPLLLLAAGAALHPRLAPPQRLASRLPLPHRLGRAAAPPRLPRLVALAPVAPGEESELIRIGAADAAAPPPAASSTLTATINLSKNIICGGFLSLPAGVAYCSAVPRATTLLPATLAMLGVGALSAYCFGLIGRTCALEKQSTYHGAWATVSAPSSLSSKLVKGSLAAKAGVTCLSYSMILADMVSQLSGAGRTLSLLRISAVGILPLCMLDTTKTLGVLKYTSVLGLAATGYILAFMGFRWLGGAYAAGGSFYNQLPQHLTPSFGAATSASSSVGTLVFISMLATAYMAHYNAPAFMRDVVGARVQSHADGTTTLSPVDKEGMRRFLRVVAMAFTIAFSTFAAVASFGFLTFGAASAGNVLTNYARMDVFARTARVALGVSLLAGYPFAFASLRDSAWEMCGGERSTLSPRTISLALLAVITLAASLLTDLGFVCAFAGALLGSSVIYLFPSIMFRRALRRQDARTKGGMLTRSRRLRLEMMATYLVSAVGFAFMICGSTMTLFTKMSH